MPRRPKQEYFESDIEPEVDIILDILIHYGGSYAQLGKAFRKRIIERNLFIDEF
ncbi:MAG: hypothetical protein KKF16_08920 [Euryarchaeota archaeon]|nr:hypothetical protein [Euryarchaeota archaeon]MBU4608207.1 hypothetical protein [Euryarchaeota archaeon]MBV1729507.1 hypothetical protein [Methanobacterium sp.]MBV1754858.1 hypothetical protein [Methanobacterium sp.]